eukprot:GGOE01049303.1.p1 GENE.GGOE01049303.1~~GGOE01049303.1.p1  ORF type:complete len:241 (+),score=39.82 GGOE01049303.1:62-784(+)
MEEGTCLHFHVSKVKKGHPCPNVDAFHTQYHSFGLDAISRIKWNTMDSRFIGSGEIQFKSESLARKALDLGPWAYGGAQVVLTGSDSVEVDEENCILRLKGFSDALDCKELYECYSGPGIKVKAIHVPMQRNHSTGSVDIQFEDAESLQRARALPIPALHHLSKCNPKKPVKLAQCPGDCTSGDIIELFSSLGDGAVANVLHLVGHREASVWFTDSRAKQAALSLQNPTLGGCAVTLDFT